MKKEPLSMDVHIKNKLTGEVVCIKHTINFMLGEYDLYEWIDGNLACSCNRGILFRRAKGIGNGEELCGDDLYPIKIYNNGELIYTEVDE